MIWSVPLTGVIVIFSRLPFSQTRPAENVPEWFVSLAKVHIPSFEANCVCEILYCPSVALHQLPIIGVASAIGSTFIAGAVGAVRGVVSEQAESKANAAMPDVSSRAFFIIILLKINTRTVAKIVHCPALGQIFEIWCLLLIKCEM